MRHGLGALRAQAERVYLDHGLSDTTDPVGRPLFNMLALVVRCDTSAARSAEARSASSAASTTNGPG